MARFLGRQSEQVAELVKQATGRRMKVEIDSGGLVEAEPPPLAPVSDQAVRDLPAVARAMELFDATIVDVQEEEKSEDRGSEATDV